MKLYDTTGHRSYEVEPKDININKTREQGAGYMVFVHEGTKYDSPHRLEGVFHATTKMYNKIINTPRKKW